MFLVYSCFFFIAVQSGQYHLPFGGCVRPTHSKWNHSTLHYKIISINDSRQYEGEHTSELSQPTISPKDTRLQTQYVGSLGSMGISLSTLMWRAPGAAEELEFGSGADTGARRSFLLVERGEGATVLCTVCTGEPTSSLVIESLPFPFSFIGVSVFLSFFLSSTVQMLIPQ